MFELDGTWVFSASDLVTALRCEYQVLHKRAERAGLVEAPTATDDLVLKRAADLGIAHETAVLDRLVAADGQGTAGQAGGVVTIAQPSTHSRDQLEAAHALTLAALQGGAEVVYQAAFFHDGFHGLADFVVRTIGPDGHIRYEPADTKLARHARVEALLQLAAYADQLVAMGFPAPREVHLWLGDGTTSSHRYADLAPILHDRSERLRALLAEPVAVPAWGDPSLRACGWCDHCLAAEKDSRDVLLVAGVRVDQRRKLRDAGITTIDELAAATQAPADLKQETFDKIHAQAVLQARQDATRTAEDPLGTVEHELYDPAAIALIPPPNPGDVFFDFEGDPLFLEPGWPELGLEYLFGSITHDTGAPVYWPLWAHDRRAERAALETYIDWLVARRATPGFEGLHVYHYAPYEVTQLKRMVQRYGTRSDELDRLLIDGVFVDLYSVVRRSIRISERSYSIKRLEPLYMGDDLRTSEVAGGADSIIWYGNYTLLREQGAAAEAQAQLDELASYNEYDCLSTLRLRDWLLSLPGGLRPEHVAPDEASSRPPESAEHLAALALEQRLIEPFADTAPEDRTPHEQAVALLAAALLFHRRESLPFWWAHFARMSATVDDWEHDGEMVVLDPADLEVVQDWHVPEGRRTFQRTLSGTALLPGSFKLSPGSECHTIYDSPLPPKVKQPSNADRGFRGGARLISIEPELLGDRVRVTFSEGLPGGLGDGEPGADQGAVPAALSAGSPPPIGKLASAILAIASDALDVDGQLAAHPALDILQRIAPRTAGGGTLPPVVDHGFAGAITEAVRSLDRSYLAVQGPPGTGKTTTGAAVIKALVDDGWKVGVVAQGHKTIEAMLEKVIDSGVAAHRVVKRAQGSGDHRGQKLSDAKLKAAVLEPGQGCLVGGTKWDFVNENRIPPGSLDLVVIDEAGQFALADTIAVSQAAPRLLLLGDPQQLPQVSQAQHPAPVQLAALDWLSRGHDTLPDELGYFLDTTYRMHPDLAAVSSHLSYEDRLEAHPCTAERVLAGIQPGLHTVLVEHDGNRTASIEEARTVRSLVQDAVGRTWSAEAGERPLGAADVLVVAPYNAQVNLIRTLLDEGGLHEVRVGTVDKFQGQEAAVVVVSMASSSAASGRGASFVLSRNRLNVALSRAQHTTYLVHAPQLTDLIPSSPYALAQLGAFLGVSRAGRGSS